MTALTKSPENPEPQKKTEAEKPAASTTPIQKPAALKTKRADWLKTIALIIVGTSFMAFGYSIFLVPNKIAAGGFSGFASVLYNKTGFSAGLLTFLLNIPLFLFSYKSVGKKFFYLSAVGVTVYALLIELVRRFQVDITDFIVSDAAAPDALLYALYGGVTMGFGTGLVVRASGSTGGSDMLANLINRRFKVKLGQVIFIIDTFVVLLNAVVFKNITIGLYSLIAIFVSSRCVDFIVDGFKECKAFYIISEKYEEIAAEILKRLDRGVTGIPGKGMYTGEAKNVLFVVVKRLQQNELKKIIHQIDPRAFIFSVSAKEVLGEGFAA
jgi:uncharacterized membrane-anchored protein YitT (DUF2179 family)